MKILWKSVDQIEWFSYKNLFFNHGWYFVLKVVNWGSYKEREGNIVDKLWSCSIVYTEVLYICFQEFDAMLKNSIPEIQRCNLTSVVLQLLALEIDALTFDFMDMPPKEVSFFCYSKCKKWKHNWKKSSVCMFHLQMTYKLNFSKYI